MKINIRSTIVFLGMLIAFAICAANLTSCSIVGGACSPGVFGGTVGPCGQGGGPTPGACPQVTTATISSSGGTLQPTPCDNFSANIVYPSMSSGSTTNANVLSSVVATNFNCTPAPTTELWFVDITPAATFTFAASPAVQFTMPAADASNTHTYYYCIRDVGGSAAAGLAGTLSGQTVTFPNNIPWPTLTANHDYEISFFYV
jgi:hypothetical protein